MKELLFSLTKKDFEIAHFCAGGKGGQHQNKTASASRIKHTASGAIGESREHRSQHMNTKAAFKRLLETEKFKLWHKLECARLMGQTKSRKQLEKEVEEWCRDENLKIEFYAPKD